MILPYLKNIDRALYNRYTAFNLPYLNDLKIYLATPMPDDIFVKNILAKDEVDEFKVPAHNVPKKLHSALTNLIDQLYFYNEEENATINSLITYLSMSVTPDLAYIHSKLAPLQEIHSKLIDLETRGDGVTVFAKFLYNRSRMLAMQSTRGLNKEEMTLRTDFDKLVDAKDLAKMLCRMNNIYSAVTSIRMEMGPPVFTSPQRDIHQMIDELSNAMLAYRKSLIAPEKAGMGDVDMAASEAHLWNCNPTPAADENLMDTIERYNKMELPFTPSDFLLTLNEGVRLSGINLMV